MFRLPSLARRSRVRHGRCSRWLQARFGSHIVITTIMFNFIAASLMVFLLTNTFRITGSMAPQTRTFAAGGTLPPARRLFLLFGLRSRGRTAECQHLSSRWFRGGRGLLSDLRTQAPATRSAPSGFNPTAAIYAGIRFIASPSSPCDSGALAGMMALKTRYGRPAPLQIEFVQGAGFVGIAVALMGRAHPVGIVVASILFGMLNQGGAELAFDMPAISRDMIVVIQGLVILFPRRSSTCSAPELTRAFALMSTPQRRADDGRQGRRLMEL